MATTERAQQKYSLKLNESRLVSVDLTGFLDSGELVAGITSVTGSPTGLAISNEAVNNAVLEILGNSVAVGQACQFVVDTSGVTFATGTVSKNFTIGIWFTTDSTPAQSVYAEVPLKVYQ